MSILGVESAGICYSPVWLLEAFQTLAVVLLNPKDPVPNVRIQVVPSTGLHAREADILQIVWNRRYNIDLIWQKPFTKGTAYMNIWPTTSLIPTLAICEGLWTVNGIVEIQIIGDPQYGFKGLFLRTYNITILLNSISSREETSRNFLPHVNWLLNQVR